MSKIALVIGGTGLVGSRLLEQLFADDRFAKVIAFGRKKSGKSHAKLEDQVIDFDAPDSWASLVKGDVAFSTLGTTLDQAGSKAAQKKVDFDYQLEFAKAAAKNGVSAYVLVSSASANADSRMFYTRIKGELDRDVQTLGFERVRILRPSMLVGDRKEKARTGEKIGNVFLNAVNAVGIARKYRGIDVAIVAKGMINSALDPKPGTRIITLDEIFEEAERAR
ncbi:MAG: NAD(P)H-binding protein [Polyangiaceae bacterium]